MFKFVAKCLLLILVSNQALALVVYDPTQVAKTVELIRVAQSQLDNMQKQYSQMIRSYEQLKKEYEALTGATKYSDFLNGKAEKEARAWMINDADEIAKIIEAGMNPGSYNDRLEYYMSKFPSVPAEDIDPNNADSISRAYYIQANSRTKYNFMAADEEISRVKQRIQVIEALIDDIKNAKTLKESMDLNTRMLAEVAFLNQSQVNLNALSLSNDALTKQSELNSIEAVDYFINH